MKHYWRLVVAGTILGMLGGPTAAAQEWTRDSTVLTQLRRTSPCPATVPAAWLRPDSLLARSPRCPLVAATAKLLAASPDPDFRAATRARCVTVHAFAFDIIPAKKTGEAYWTVEFVGDTGHAVGARIDRVTGTITLRRFPNEFGASVAEAQVVGQP
jgi:hypothetical protein